MSNLIQRPTYQFELAEPEIFSLIEPTQREIIVAAAINWCVEYVKVNCNGEAFRDTDSYRQARILLHEAVNEQQRYSGRNLLKLFIELGPPEIRELVAACLVCRREPIDPERLTPVYRRRWDAVTPFMDDHD